MKTGRLILLLTLATILTSCGKDETKFLKGNFTGSYYYHEPIKSATEKSPNAVNLKLEEGNTFNTNSFPDRKPGGGSGSYTVLQKNFIEFEDQNVWTADFDWNLILNGRFTYEIKGDSLILTRYWEPCPQCITTPPLYQYRLKRID